MNEKSKTGIEDLLALFSDTLTPADVLSAKLMSQISGAITSERLKRNMSQKDFAEYIDATQSLVSRWEKGNYNFSINKIADILTKLGLNADFKVCKSSVSEDDMVTSEVSCSIIQFPAKYVSVQEELEEM